MKSCYGQPRSSADSISQAGVQWFQGPSVASEEQLQQQIAAKLGLKSGKKLAQEDDNMSEFLTGISIGVIKDA